MEEVAWTLQATFSKKPALSGISVGESHAEDAIRLAAFGVQANDFIRLQQFLPKVTAQSGGLSKLTWTQDEYGHPGNWNEEAARFCLAAVIDIAVKLQRAAWIPGPIPFYAIYEHKVEAIVEAIKDGVEIWNLSQDKAYSLDLDGNVVNRKLVKTLSKGMTLRAFVTAEKKATGLSGLTQEKSPTRAELSIITIDGSGVNGYVANDDVRVICVPRDNEIVKEYFPELPEIEWLPPLDR